MSLRASRIGNSSSEIKEHVRDPPLQKDLEGAHCVVTDGSIESVVLGTPVFVHRDSAASLVGRLG
jgi:hypothetical protein